MANDNIHELPGIDYVDYVNIIYINLISLSWLPALSWLAALYTCICKFYQIRIVIIYPKTLIWAFFWLHNSTPCR